MCFGVLVRNVCMCWCVSVCVRVCGFVWYPPSFGVTESPPAVAAGGHLRESSYPGGAWPQTYRHTWLSVIYAVEARKGVSGNPLLVISGKCMIISRTPGP